MDGWEGRLYRERMGGVCGVCMGDEVKVMYGMISSMCVYVLYVSIKYFRGFLGAKRRSQ